MPALDSQNVPKMPDSFNKLSNLEGKDESGHVGEEENKENDKQILPKTVDDESYQRNEEKNI